MIAALDVSGSLRDREKGVNCLSSTSMILFSFVMTWMDECMQLIVTVVAHCHHTTEKYLQL